MTGGVRVKVRGVYATALTSLLLKHGFHIVKPTPVIQARFGLEPSELEEEVTIHDRHDRQGVVIRGEKAEVVVNVLKETLPEAIFREAAALPELKGARLTWEQFRALARSGFEVEFPYQVKLSLDEIRSSVVPTISEHHLLKTAGAQSVDEVESQLPSCPERNQELARELKWRLIYIYYQVGREMLVRHVKLTGKVVAQRGMVREFRPGEVVLERHFHAGGFYDGLNLPKEEGDYGLVELQEKSWWHRRSYFSRSGDLKGEIYNVNTPVEFYPDGVRYVDLEVDVVRVGQEVRVIDKEVLESRMRKGIITPTLSERALAIAHRLAEQLAGG